jgi:hypothetical protein
LCSAKLPRLHRRSDIASETAGRFFYFESWGIQDANQGSRIRGVLRQRTNTGFSNYNGVQLEYRANNILKQLTVRAGYTFSKTLDNVSEIFSTGAAGNTVAFPQNPLDPSRGEIRSPVWIIRTLSASS